MNIHFRTHNMREITPSVQSEFAKLTMSFGLMRGRLNLMMDLLAADPKDPEGQGYVIAAYCNEVAIAWALIFACPRLNNPDRHDAYFFVHEDYRKKGIGRVLARATLGLYPDVVFHPWDTRSHGFFDTIENSHRPLAKV